MGTLMIIYDPTDKIKMVPVPGIAFASLSIPHLSDDEDNLDAVARSLAALLVQEISKAG